MVFRPNLAVKHTLPTPQHGQYITHAPWFSAWSSFEGPGETPFAKFPLSAPSFPPPPPLRPRYVVQFITGGGGGGGGWLLGGSLCDPSPALPVFSSLCVFRLLSTPFVWHTSYRAGKYVPYSVLSASLENITTRLHMKGCKGVHNLCVGVGLFYQTSSSPQLQLR